MLRRVAGEDRDYDILAVPPGLRRPGGERPLGVGMQAGGSDLMGDADWRGRRVAAAAASGRRDGDRGDDGDVLHGGFSSGGRRASARWLPEPGTDQGHLAAIALQGEGAREDPGVEHGDESSGLAGPERAGD